VQEPQPAAAGGKEIKAARPPGVVVAVGEHLHHAAVQGVDLNEPLVAPERPDRTAVVDQALAAGRQVLVSGVGDSHGLRVAARVRQPGDTREVHDVPEPAGGSCERTDVTVQGAGQPEHLLRDWIDPPNSVPPRPAHIATREEMRRAEADGRAATRGDVNHAEDLPGSGIDPHYLPPGPAVWRGQPYSSGSGRDRRCSPAQIDAVQDRVLLQV